MAAASVHHSLPSFPVAVRFRRGAGGRACRPGLCAVILLGLFCLLGACDEGTSNSRLALDSLSLDTLTERARAEGVLYTVAMPDNWANWGQTWRDLKRLYGISHADRDMNSAEEIALFAMEKNAPTKDLGDVGISYALEAQARGLTLPYKTSWWEQIPAWAKDAEGHWIVCYTGTICFLVNTNLVPDPPRSWEEVRKGTYTVALGDVATSTQAQWAFFSANVAFGGSADNLQPGLEFWKELARAGRISLLRETGRADMSAIPLCARWDFTALTYRARRLAEGDASYVALIPRDGAVQAGYASIINARAPHPHAAALAREYILSDAGQINIARGFARPIRDVPLPDEVRRFLLPAEEYAQAKIVKGVPHEIAEKVAVLWEQQIVPILRRPAE